MTTKSKIPENVDVSKSVSVKLSGTDNYLEWKRMIMKLIRSRGLTGFTLDDHGRRRLIDENWEKIDEILKGWIMATVDESILDSIVGLKTCRDMFELLARNFSQPTLMIPASLNNGARNDPEDVNVSDFVTVKLSGANHFVWKSMMLSLIESQGLMGFIIEDKHVGDGSYSSKDWKRKDEILRRWILATVNENILGSIVRLGTARAMWGLLAQKYSQAFSYQAVSTGAEGNDSHGMNVSGRYLPLAKAALNNDWLKGAQFVKQDPDSIRADITGNSETALMLAVRSGRRIEFVTELLAIMSAEDVSLVNDLGSTALHMAAGAGNMEAAKLLVAKNPELPYTSNYTKLLPLHEAASRGQKEMVLYLINTDFSHKLEAINQLLVFLISSGLYDVAHSVVQRYPESATSESSPLTMLTRQYSAFLSGAQINFWQRIIYSCAPVKTDDEEIYHSRNRDIENASSGFISAKSNLYQLFWIVADKLVPQVKDIRDKKLIHYQAQQLSKQLVQEIVKLKIFEAADVLTKPLIEAAATGVHEIVEEIFYMFPGAIYFTNTQDQTVFQIAILNRCEKVFNIIYQLEENQLVFLMTPDVSLNNALTLAGRLEEDQKVKLRASVSGAALQMQRELQWFKEVEKLTGLVEKKMNSDGKTASEIFTETHEELVKEGEEWMKDAARSCTIVAALIVTIVFAAAITVPGGTNSNTGFPLFSKQKSFIVFAISDVLALFSSTSSLLMFLSIITSRYSEGDFLYELPKKLIIGLTTLFLSIIFMMIAFTAAVDILFGDLSSWIFVSVVTLASVPVILFMSLQFPLLIDIVRSTYGSGIFGKQSHRIVY